MDFCGFCKLRLGAMSFFKNNINKGEFSFYRIACNACRAEHGGYLVTGIAASGMAQ